MEKISKDEYYIDGERVNQHNMTKYIETLSYYDYMPKLYKYRENDSFMEWQISYGVGVGCKYMHSLTFTKKTGMWLTGTDLPYSYNLEPKHPSYPLLKIDDGYYEWTSQHIEDIFPVAFLCYFDKKSIINPKNCYSIKKN